MTQRGAKEQTNPDRKSPLQRSGETHSGTPNAEDPNKAGSTEHKSGYGGEGGEPRTSSDDRDENGN